MVLEKRVSHKCYLIPAFAAVGHRAEHNRVARNPELSEPAHGGGGGGGRTRTRKREASKIATRLAEGYN